MMHDMHFSKQISVIVPTMDAIFARYKPTAVIHLAAESHVDRSITGADAFLETNIIGTYRLLEAAKSYYATLGA